MNPVPMMKLVETIRGHETSDATVSTVLEIASSLGKPGTPATFIVWRWERDTPDLVPQRIVVRGRTVYDAETLPTEVPFGRTAKPATREEAERWLKKQSFGSHL